LETGQIRCLLDVFLVGNFASPGHPGGEPTVEQKQVFFALAEHLMVTLYSAV